MNTAKIIAQGLSGQNSPRRGKAGSYKFCLGTPAILFVLLTVIAGRASATCDSNLLTLKVKNAVIRAEVARTETQREKGLMGRRALPENWGMWFTFGGPSVTQFWMKGTHVALDIIFMSRDMKILHIHENARPMDETPIGSPVVFWYVLEVPSGFARAHQLHIGDTISSLTPKC